jgi:hypothetical protein
VTYDNFLTILSEVLPVGITILSGSLETGIGHPKNYRQHQHQTLIISWRSLKLMDGEKTAKTLL